MLWTDIAHLLFATSVSLLTSYYGLMYLFYPARMSRSAFRIYPRWLVEDRDGNLLMFWNYVLRMLGFGVTCFSVVMILVTFTTAIVFFEKYLN